MCVSRKYDPRERRCLRLNKTMPLGARAETANKAMIAVGMMTRGFGEGRLLGVAGAVLDPRSGLPLLIGVPCADPVTDEEVLDSAGVEDIDPDSEAIFFV